MIFEGACAEVHFALLFNEIIPSGIIAARVQCGLLYSTM